MVTAIMKRNRVLAIATSNANIRNVKERILFRLRSSTVDNPNFVVWVVIPLLWSLSAKTSDTTSNFSTFAVN
jgi:hypothetical protein